MESFFIEKKKKRIMKTNIRCFWYVYILKYSIHLFYYYKTLYNFNYFFFLLFHLTDTLLKHK